MWAAVEWAIRGCSRTRGRQDLIRGGRYTRRRRDRSKHNGDWTREHRRRITRGCWTVGQERWAASRRPLSDDSEDRQGPWVGSSGGREAHLWLLAHGPDYGSCSGLWIGA